MDSCLFCNIIAGKIPSNIIYETDTLVVFPDIHPAADIHFLIVPKEHIREIGKIGLPAGKAGEDRGKLLTQIYRVANELVEKNNLKDSSYRVLVNGGKAQHIPHLHFHLLGGTWRKFV
ncbi:hypothetical protein A3F00_04450 [Candidatus Daviesbacteria bacterium RIFCSPHIGHO2_12_FULL_37_11]|uniref:HIT domain-containing protein n=1 Tax=Candidatus Daviesbacteria bacterium RIFCSPHIGHO2_12_FULL_37_11 TaxID=1797777 RepID=A0A1F5KA35_9BACT|nr:MAG: hypothetical protein A2111_01960 [Candidatus Daviesbacteria bacterium GWA1_38_6]OGE16151.1 MAG: hypothetical protein A2769_03620 [Candidatus Daviesbacteria bacterium RIFCSPHIGHO2_01_FULL_37_27]OGE37674.1 MAG: hypothetical protein A3F00_04450 [Candidatus Daviesbacteria bacterium RIFCSPHIGHO2_12_FULL_37_11]OGE45429.1 MAG: hypothetical protein A3B39_04850 [Candidatus Daviesbacteria bacterium RIFCSPLOWO2_01_FULL_37_10]